ncbi:glycerol dehydrogenase [Achromobacter aloeverae]|uniref:Glycerol dehydrogenase n=1 Tax=Achromobacter aloeverae TaxID=1750518 RepID=A0A4Q1HLH5_9BURK|nr:glycerol dehydrogenase [Achromobacter aloeverae]RXN91313.1 alcohol dehydrogenase [Achromobacter aloeverae]
MLKIFGGPSRYIQGPDAIAHLGETMALFGPQAALVIDSYVLDVHGARLRDLCAASGVDTHVLAVEGEMTPASIQDLCRRAAATPARAVAAVGGGKALDAGKAVARALHCHLVTVPTVASNDAPTSKNYVLYDDRHNLVAVEHMLFNPTMVLVDTALVATAPANFFRAGLGDAISKKFEAAQCHAAGGPNMYNGTSTLTAQLIADGCYRTLLADGAAALAAAGSGQPTPAFERAVEAMILMSGLGFESGGLSIAHALTRGLPRIAGVGHALHGLQVAVGLLVQLELERRDDAVLAGLEDWYAAVGLPVTLKDLGASGIDDGQLRTAAELTLNARHAANFGHALTVEELAGALKRRAG